MYIIYLKNKISNKSNSSTAEKNICSQGNQRGDDLKGVRLADIDDVKSMSYVHARTWKGAYGKYIPMEYLNNISDDGWIPLFTRAFVNNIHEAAVYELEGLITGTVTYGIEKCKADSSETNACCSNINEDCSKFNEKSEPNVECSKNTNCLEFNTKCSKINAGCSDFSKHRSELYEGEIISLYVLPEYWSTKQGYELTKFAIDRLKNQGCKSCYLWVIKENERAVNFYRKFGFYSTTELNTIIYAGQNVIVEKYRMNLS